MTVYVLPNTRLFRPRRMELALRPTVSSNRSPMNGVVTTVEFPGDHWMLRLDYGLHTEAERREHAGFWSQLRGSAHVLRCWNIAHPMPEGLAGGATLASSVLADAMQMNIAVPAGSSLRRGDMLGIGQGAGLQGQLLMVSDAVYQVLAGTPTITVTLASPLRKAYAGGTSITVQRPYADFLLTDAVSIPFEPKVCPPFSVEAVEFVT